MTNPFYVLLILMVSAIAGVSGDTVSYVPSLSGGTSDLEIADNIQYVYANQLTVSESPDGNKLTVKLAYRATAQTTGVGVGIYFDSTQLAVENVVFTNTPDSMRIASGAQVADSGDQDSNLATDQWLSLSYVSLFSTFPTETPLISIIFVILGNDLASLTSPINLVKTSNDVRYTFQGQSLEGAVVLCNPGQQTVGLWCEACAAGKASAAGLLCTACDPGKFAADPGETECEDCSAGEESNSARTGCEACAAGKASVAGVTCTACVSGKFAADAGETVCEDCSAGEESNSARTGCKTCAAGAWSNKGGTCESVFTTFTGTEPYASAAAYLVQDHAQVVSVAWQDADNCPSA